MTTTTSSSPPADEEVKLTYVSAEPFLGHFGIRGRPQGETLLGMFPKKESITAIMNTAMEAVEKDASCSPTVGPSTSLTR